MSTSTLCSVNWRYTEAARQRLPADAALARDLAAVNCGNCRWYHSSWTTWRALELGSGADIHREFYRDAMPRLPQNPRLLLSGTGDNALLASAMDALGSQLPAARLHVLDRCATPLRMCEAFARSNDIRVRSHRANILDFDHNERFHVVMVHAFLGFFEPGVRPALFQRWHDLLLAGGHLLMVQRLRPSARSSTVRFAGASDQQFVDAALSAASAAPGRTDLDGAALAAAARDYARHKHTHPVSSVETLMALARGAGLHVTSCEVAAMLSSGRAAPGPSMRSGDDYVKLVAVRA